MDDAGGAGIPPRFAWYAKTFDPADAGIRLRCLAPMDSLARMGVAVERFSTARRGIYNAVVFKAYSDEAIAEASALRGAGKRVVFDICDNHFAGDENGDPKLVERSARLERMLLQASDIVVSTPTLGMLIAMRVPDVAARLRIIPDPVDEHAAADARVSLIERFAMWRLRRFLGRHKTALRLVWFGNNGSGHMPSGFTDLNRICPLIEDFHQTHPVTLTVIGNSRRRYRRVAAACTVPVRYKTWSRDTISAALASHDVAIIPVSQNDFTLGKTINRPSTAILAGLGVVADAIPSYEELRPYVVLDDWQGGLARYAARKNEERGKISQAQAHLRCAYDRTKIGRLWRDVLEMR